MHIQSPDAAPCMSLVFEASRAGTWLSLPLKEQTKVYLPIKLQYRQFTASI